MDEKLPLVFNKPSKDESIKFQNKEIPNYEIEFIQDYGSYSDRIKIGSLKEIIKMADKQIKKKFMRENKEFYSLLMAHLIAHYIIDKINLAFFYYTHKNIEKPVKMYRIGNQVYQVAYVYKVKDIVKPKQKYQIAKQVYQQALGEPAEKFLYLGNVWSKETIDLAYIRYLILRPLPEFSQEHKSLSKPKSKSFLSYLKNIINFFSKNQ
jgi:hypothetical protein